MLYQRHTIRQSSANQHGFTLVEIMVVVAIIGIASALAAPNFTAMYARYELNQATSDFYNRLLFARSAAINRSAMIVATPANVAGAKSQVTFTAPLGMDELPPGVNFMAPLPLTPIGFTPRGRSTQPATQTIQLQSTRVPNMIYTISLAPSGKLTWCKRQITVCLVNAT